jgi:TonB family protein
MKTNSENEVYIIGKGSPRPQRRKRLIIVLLVSIVLLLTAATAYFSMGDVPYKSSDEITDLEVFPKDATAPKFDDKEDFSEFLKWVGSNLQYPKGHETEEAKVIVSFTISKQGDMTNIEIISQPEDKSFGREVVSLLKRCPHWSPAILANGEKVSVNYKLPISFTPKRKY